MAVVLLASPSDVSMQPSLMNTLLSANQIFITNYRCTDLSAASASQSATLINNSCAWDTFSYAK